MLQVNAGSEAALEREFHRVARKLSALADLGFQRVEPTPLRATTYRIDRHTYRITWSRPAMGTSISASVVSRSRTRAEEGLGRAFGEMDRLIAVLSRFDPTSPVWALNHDGAIDHPPTELALLVHRAMSYYRISAGAFDITVKPLVDLFRDRLCQTVAREPSDGELAETLERVGAEHVEITDRAIRFARPDMGITLDGIAKGFIVDRMSDALVRHGLNNHLINAGGEIKTAGTKEHGQPWTVAVESPWARGDWRDAVHPGGGAVATSGSYEIAFNQERSYHHIVSARTGKSPVCNASVTVVAPSTMAADALATSVFGMTPETGIRFLDGLPRCAGLIIGSDGTQHRSRDWESVRVPLEARAEP